MYAEILRYVYKHVKDADIAEDITQETFFEFNRYKHQIKEIRAYLYRIATCAIIRRKREQKKLPITIDTLNMDRLFEAASVVKYSDDNHPLYKAITQLTAAEQAVIKAVYFDSLSTAAAADILKMNQNTVLSHLARGREKIRRQLVDITLS